MRQISILWLLYFLCFSNRALGADYTESKLSNGLDVILFPSKKVPLVTIVLSSKAGAFTESPETDGLTHLWEHMFFKGNSKWPDQEAFNRQIQKLGIIFNGDTSAEKVRYYFTLPAENLEEGLDLMYQAITSPNIDNDELKKEIQVVLDEYDRNASEPYFKLHTARKKALYGDKDYLRDPLGRRETISVATREQLIAIKNDVFIPSNCSLLISGYFDPQDLMGRVDKLFSFWKNTPSQLKLGAIPPFPKKQKILIDVSDRVRTSSLLMNFQGPSVKADVRDTYIADMIINLISSRQGKFYKTYIDSGKLNGASMGFQTQSQVGELTLYASGDGKAIMQARKDLIRETELWATPDYFSDQELQNARDRLVVMQKYESNEPSNYIKTLAFWWAVTGLDYHKNYIANLQQVTKKDIKEFVEKYFKDKPYITSLLLTKQDSKDLKLQSNIN